MAAKTTTISTNHCPKQSSAVLHISLCIVLLQLAIVSIEAFSVHTNNHILLGSESSLLRIPRLSSSSSTRTRASPSWPSCFQRCSCSRVVGLLVGPSYGSTKSNDSFMDEADELFSFMALDEALDLLQDDDDEGNDEDDEIDMDHDIEINPSDDNLVDKFNDTISSSFPMSPISYSASSTLHLAPASEIAYFYLKNTVQLSEDTMWKIIQKSSSILGLTVSTLQRKIALLTQTMNLTEDDMRVIIHKQPSILTMSANRNLSPTILFLVRALDLGKDDLRTIVVQFPCILCYSIHNLQAKIQFFHTDMEYNTDQIRTLLVKEPKLLTAAVKTGLQPRMKFLHREIGIPLVELQSIVQRNPKLLLYSLTHNLEIKLISFFIMRLRMEPKHVLKLLKSYPFIMDYNLENHMLPIARFFLSELEFSPIEFRSILLKFPRLMTHSMFKIKHTVGYFRYQLGMNAAQVKRVLFQAPQVVSLNTEHNLVDKVEFLQHGLGLDRGDELRKVISGMPTLLLCSIDNNLRPKIEYLREVLGGEEDEAELRRVVLTLPTLLGYSLEKRIQPRMERIMEIGLDPKKITIGITMKETKFEEWLLHKKQKIECQSGNSMKRMIRQPIQLDKSEYNSETTGGGLVSDSSFGGKAKLTEEQRKGRIVHWKR